MKSSYYHATSRKNADSIEKNGFRCSIKGALGPGVYFAEKAECTIGKANCSVLDAIIVVHIQTGRIKDVTQWHNWTKRELNSLGYDYVRRIHCLSGNEICVFDTYRITIIGVVYWDTYNVEIKEYYDKSVDVSEFHFLIKDRKLKIDSINKPTNTCNSNWTTSQFILFGSYALNCM